MASPKLHVVIVGGGIGGLCLAQGLRQSGVGAAVYERDRSPTSRVQGYRIRISPRGARALRECLPVDLWRAFVASCGRSTTTFRLVSHWLVVLLRADAPANGDGERDYSASRIALRRILLAGLDEIVHFDKAFTRYEVSPDGRVTAFFEDGTAAAGDVLIGADGGNSRVRRQLLPQAERVDTGIRAIGGKVILTDEARGNLSPALFDGPTLVRAPGGCAMFLAAHDVDRPSDRDAGLGDPETSSLYPDPRFHDAESYLMWAVSGRQDGSGFPAEPGQLDESALRDFALQVCSSWHPAFTQMIGMTDPSTVSLIKIRTSVPVAPWPTGRITLMGDALHSMTPYRGIGGNVALRDASLLCRTLTAVDRGERPLLPAIHDYEAAMIDYGFKAVRSSLQAAEMAHSDSAVGRVFSNAMFRVLNALPSVKARMFAGRGADE
jgi:2-polyprenyl-6-methoxyphenol hydroxylase-like FAD-dependent oxidoreductase